MWHSRNQRSATSPSRGGSRKDTQQNDKSIATNNRREKVSRSFDSREIRGWEYTSRNPAPATSGHRARKVSRPSSIASEDLILPPPPPPLSPFDAPADYSPVIWGDVPTFTSTSGLLSEGMYRPSRSHEMYEYIMYTGSFLWADYEARKGDDLIPAVPHSLHDLRTGGAPKSLLALAKRLYNNACNNILVTDTAYSQLQTRYKDLEEKYKCLHQKFMEHKKRGELFFEMDEPYQEHYLLFSFIHRFFQRKMIPGWLTDIIDEIDEKCKAVKERETVFYKDYLQFISCQPWSYASLSLQKDAEDSENQREEFCRSSRRLPAVMHKSQTYRTVRHRCNLQRESSKLPQHQHLILYIQGDAKKLIPKITTGEEYDNISGRRSVNMWERTVGKSKSWKRCPKTTASKQTHRTRVQPIKFGHRFARSVLWLPFAFVRTQDGKWVPRAYSAVRPRDPDRRSEREASFDFHIRHEEDYCVKLQRRHRLVGVVHDDKSQKSEPLTINQDEGEPSSAFIRLTWKDTFLTNGTGQLERFLPTNLLFRSGWRIDRFLRNDSHSDVYSLSPTRYSIPDSGPKQDLEAHVFLDEYHGNCENYARRQKRRMQESGNCLDTFWYNGRHVFIMNVPRQPPQQFKMRNVEEEFPTLIDPRKCKEHAALQRRNFHGRPSFAAIIGRKTPDTRVVFQPRSMPQVKTAFEKELEQIEKTRRKKQEKQRLKRRTQRDRKLEERAREQGVSEDKMVDVAHTGGTLREVERISMGAAAGGAAAQ